MCMASSIDYDEELALKNKIIELHDKLMEVDAKCVLIAKQRDRLREKLDAINKVRFAKGHSSSL